MSFDAEYTIFLASNMIQQLQIKHLKTSVVVKKSSWMQEDQNNHLNSNLDLNQGPQQSVHTNQPVCHDSHICCNGEKYDT